MDTNPRFVQSAPMIQETTRCSWLYHEILTLKRWKEAVVIKEIILAMNANLDGENTAEFIKQKYQGLSLIFSSLGRGLSTVAELEYADPETLKNAFLHRTK